VGHKFVISRHPGHGFACLDARSGAELAGFTPVEPVERNAGHPQTAGCNATSRLPGVWSKL
jgi:hypothetical protein